MGRRWECVRSKRLRSVGLALVMLGAAALVAPTLGFQTLEADRGVTAGTAPDPNALLGVVDDSSAATADVAVDQPGVPYYLDDNYGDFQTADLSATAVAFDGQPTDLEANVTGDPGSHDFRVELHCGDSALDASGHPTIAVQAADGVSIELERTTDQPIDVDCRSGTGNGFTGTDAGGFLFTTSQQTSQTISFTPEGQLDPGTRVVIDLSEAQSGIVDYSGASVASVSRGSGGPSGTATFDDPSTLVYEPSVATGDQVTIELDDVTIQQSGQAGTYSVDFVRTDTNVAQSDQFTVYWLDWGGFGAATANGSNARTGGAPNGTAP